MPASGILLGSWGVEVICQIIENRSNARGLGEHTGEILTRLGSSEKERKTVKSNGDV